MNPLIPAWQQTIESFRDAVNEIPDEAFGRASLLPGWTIGDIIAHVIALEVELSGQPLPEHEPDWDALPHASDLFSRYTEIGVDYRRGWTPQRLREELDEVIAVRTEQLRTGPQEDREVIGIGGLPRRFDQQLKMRCFDIFLHEVDLRDALEMPAPVLADGARVTVGVMADSLGYVWVKKAGAVRGDVLHFVVPEWLDRWIGVDESGRGTQTDPTDPTVSISADVWPYIRLASGRNPDLESVSVEGNIQMGTDVVANLNVAP